MLRIAALIAAIALPAGAEPISLESAHSVDATIDRLEAIATGAGATIFARVNHAKGADSIGTPIRPATLLIFGNPKLGTPAIAADPLAGLRLPVRMLAFEAADGTVYLAYEAADDLFNDLGVGSEIEANVGKAMANLAGKAVAAE